MIEGCRASLAPLSYLLREHREVCKLECAGGSGDRSSEAIIHPAFSGLPRSIASCAQRQYLASTA